LRKSVAILATMVAALAAASALAADWPMWRYDAGRTAVSPARLPERLNLQWVRQLAPPAPAWPKSQTKLQFDASYEPVVVGKRLFVSSMASDGVTAYDTETGGEAWRFYTDGPVRFAPVAWGGKVAFASDDGHLYCLDAAGGKLLWTFRGGPADRRILGNDRLISMWPARGAPVLCGGVIYFAAGIWPFMGTFIHAVDAETGRPVWTNSGSGSDYLKQQHDSYAFAGVAPQGYLAVAGDVLLVSGGRTVPAAYDRTDGTFLYFHVGERKFGKDAGGYAVTVGDEWFFNGGAAYDIDKGKPVVWTGVALTTSDGAIGLEKGELVGCTYEPVEETYLDTRGKEHQRTVLARLWEAEPDVPLERLFIRAGDRVYAEGRDGLVAAVDLPPEGRRARVSWQGRVEGDVWNMLAADGRLFVVTRQGGLYCFGAAKKTVRTHRYVRVPLPVKADAWPDRVDRILEETLVTRGYCLVLGIGTGRLLEELVRRTDLRVIAVDPDAGKVAAVRWQMDAAGVYGRRVAAYVGDPATFPFPPYLASLVLSEDLKAAGAGRGAAFVQAVYRVLRPYGGTLCLATSDAKYGEVKGWASAAKLPGATVDSAKGLVLLTRAGAPPRSANWTHQDADVANTTVSQDDLVKAPLGLLWFGGPAHDSVLPRHGHGPSPQVVDGRVVIEGRDMIRAVDAYTGRLIWQRRMSDIGAYYDNTAHQPGANEIGSNYVTMPDGIYVAYGRECLRLDPATGGTQYVFRFPKPKRTAADAADGTGPLEDELPRGARWGYVGVYKDLLIGTALPVGVEFMETEKERPEVRPRQPREADGTDDRTRLEIDSFWKRRRKEIEDVAIHWNAPHGTGSKWLFAMDRRSGDEGREDDKPRLLWKREAEANFRHNTIVAGRDKIFCVDGLTEDRLRALRFRGIEPDAAPILYALDAQTGRVRWKVERGVFGTRLAYSEKHDILVEHAGYGRDRALDEADVGLAAYRGRDGKLLWTSTADYDGPCMILGDAIVAQENAFSLLTGKLRQRQHPLTGEVVDWGYHRNYGCNTSIAGRHLILFRSAAAGYYDWEHDGGTGNLGGFKSGCTSNLIPACGILSAPDYTRTCTCSYQNQCSVAMMHDPAVETWTFTAVASSDEPIQRLGLNVGAPGDRLAPSGTLWLEWPTVGGPTPRVRVKAEPAKPKPFRHHVSFIREGNLGWVAASGVEGVESLSIGLARGTTRTRPYTVRMHFAEPRDVAEGERVFGVALQGETVLKDFDVVKTAGGPRRAVVKEFRHVRVGDDLKVEFAAARGKTLICGIEVVAE